MNLNPKKHWKPLEQFKAERLPCHGIDSLSDETRFDHGSLDVYHKAFRGGFLYVWLGQSS